MDTSALQAGLAQLQHLLPSQREWLERLLFQLAFNDVKRIDVVAADGSGKSTLALALAELFSSQHNVALLSARIAPEQAAAELMQQWFASPLRDDVSLAKQVAKAADTTPLLLVIDDAARYPVELLQQLAALPCILCCFSDQSLAEAGLTLTLNRVTAADAAQLLQHEALNSIELAERLARANNNLHLLLLPPRQVAGPRLKSQLRPAALIRPSATVTMPNCCWSMGSSMSTSPTCRPSNRFSPGQGNLARWALPRPICA